MDKSDYQLIVFDWDGTLMDSTAAIVGAIQHACADLSLPVPTKEKAAYVIGLSLVDAFKTACPEATTELMPQLAASYQKHYHHDSPPLFSGVLDSLTSLKNKGYFLAVATGKGRNGLDHALDTTQTRSFFDTTRTVSECFSKPHPQMIFSICEELGINEKNALMIGDTTHDLQMAQNAGCAAVGVTTGAHSVEQLASCPNVGLFDDIQTVLNRLPSRL